MTDSIHITDHRGRHRAPATTNATNDATGGGASNSSNALERNKQIGKEMEYLKDRLNTLELEVLQQQQQQQREKYNDANDDKYDDNLEKRIRAKHMPAQMTGGEDTAVTSKIATRTISWKVDNNKMEMQQHTTTPEDTQTESNNNNHNNNNEYYEGKPPPMRKIKFSCLPSLPPPENNVSNKNIAVVASPLVAASQNQAAKDGDNDDDDDYSDKNAYNGGSVQSSSSSTTSSSSVADGGTVAFSGWARVFFQARHHRSATLLTPFGGFTPWSQDTYLYISIIHHTTDHALDGPHLASLKKQNTNELHICAASISTFDKTSNSDKKNENIIKQQSHRPKLLIDPPIALKYFYALKVPGSHSGAALFLRNDDRRLRKYIFRFEFVNKSVHQSPYRYANFIRSGNVAKKSMARYRGMGSRVLNQLSSAARRGGSMDAMNDKVKREKEAYEAHLSALDDLLRESSEMADRFVEVVNDLNAKEEEEENHWREMMKGGGGDGGVVVGHKKRTKPLPPYWGSGFNIRQTGYSEDDEKEDSDSDYSGDDDEDDVLNDDDDDNDDETLFDRIQVSTEQTLETLFNHIVK